MDIHSLIISGSYAAIFLLMISNGIINFPSSQILYIIVGYFVGTKVLLFIPAVIAGALGNAIGNIITYELIRKYEHPLARKLLMLDEATFNKIHGALSETFSHKGMWWIFFGKLVPSIKSFIPIVAGLASTPRKLTYLVFLSASFIWATGIITLGYFFGEHINLKSFSIVSLIVGLTILYIVYKNLKKKGVF
jgi:membrane-associated protein